MLNRIHSGNWKHLPGLWRLFYLRNKMRDRFYHAATFGWPLYDLRYYLLNLEPRKLYRARRNDLLLNPVQERVVGELEEKGISVIHLSDLLPQKVFSELQELAEASIQTTENQMRIKEVQSRTQRLPASDKFYLVRLLGDRAVLPLRNKFFVFAVSDEILRIVCGYLGMFCRLLYLNAWFNVPSDGPDCFSQKWHRDPEDKKQVKLFLYLRDVNLGTGPFCYIPGTHNGGPFAKIYRQTMDASNYPPDGAIEKLFSENQRQICVGNAGTLIFCDTTGFHKGGHAEAEPRLLFNAVYTTKSGAILWEKRAGKYYSIADWTNGSLGFLAEHAIGLHKARRSKQKGR